MLTANGWPVKKMSDLMGTDDEPGRVVADSVNHPAHYNSGRIEVIEAIEDWKLNYHRGNAVKYVARAGKKNPAKEVEDLEKAIWYLRRDVERLKAEAEGRPPIKPDFMNHALWTRGNT